MLPSTPKRTKQKANFCYKKKFTTLKRLLKKKIPRNLWKYSLILKVYYDKYYKYTSYISSGLKN